jgi:hypothetical protein
MFDETDLVKKNLTTEEMGHYLVLRLCFSEVSADNNLKASFHTYINDAVRQFSEKYVKAKLLDEPIEVDPEDCLSSLQRLFGAVKFSGREIYLIVDDCDAFITRALLSIDTSKSDLGRNQYETDVAGAERMIRSWGNVIKEGTVSTIARAFFTGVVPVAFDDGLSCLDIMHDLRFDPEMEGLCGFTSGDVSHALKAVCPALSEEKQREHLEQMRTLYEGYRFNSEQDEPLYNPQDVLHYLHNLGRHGRPPTEFLDPADSGSTANVTKFLINKGKASAPCTLKYFALGSTSPEKSSTYQGNVVPAFRSERLFLEDADSERLIALAYYHGFLTHKPDAAQRAILSSPNAAMRTAVVKELFAGLPTLRMAQLMGMVRTAQPDLAEFRRIVTLGIEEVPKATGTVLGRALDTLTGEDI